MVEKLQIIHKFDLRNLEEKLVVLQIFCTFIDENQTVTKDISDNHQGQRYGNFLYS